MSFRDRTGRGVRIAVIDSGVSVPHPHIGVVAGGVSIDERGESRDYADNFADRIGHGTAVMAAIMEKAPGAEYFAVRVFQSSLRTRIEFLLRAIEWSIEQRVHLINLSLGTSNPERAERFAPLIARAAEAGAILVSAASALPGSMPGVISVTEDRDCPRDEFRCQYRCQYRWQRRHRFLSRRRSARATRTRHCVPSIVSPELTSRT